MTTTSDDDVATTTIATTTDDDVTTPAPTPTPGFGTNGYPQEHPSNEVQEPDDDEQDSKRLDEDYSIMDDYKKPDPVNHPSHYNSGTIEVIDAIEDWGLGFNRGNAVKYVARAGKKDGTPEVEDLEKAVWYLNREIQRLKK